MTYNCSLCSKDFHSKQYYDRHFNYCKWVHTSSSQRQQELEVSEHLSEKQKTRLIVDLMFKMQLLTNKVDSMQKDMQNLKTRQRVSMVKWLNKSKIPTKSFYEWVGSIPVSLSHLETVFQSDLLHGIMACIKEDINTYLSQKRQIPIYAFTQKNKTVYVYENSRNTPRRLNEPETNIQWMIISTDHLKKVYNILNKKFETQFKVWQEHHSQLLNTSDEWKEKDMMYSRKVMGMMENENTRTTKLKQWIYTQIHLPFGETTEN